MSKKPTVFSDKNFNKKLWQVAFPLTLQSLMLATVAAADALMLGNVDQNIMSAVSLATQIQFVQNMIIYAIVSAVGILAAQYWGKGDKGAVGDVFHLGLRLSLCVSIVFFAGCFFTPRLLMKLFTDSEALIGYGCSYLKIASFSYLLTGISQMFLQLLKVTDKAKHPAIISTTTVFLNIFLNSVFIFGLFGLPSMNEKGAALATLIARAIELVWSVGLVFLPGFFKPSFKRFFVKAEHFLAQSFYKAFFPLLGSGLLWGIGFTAYSAFMGHLGEDAAAANSVSAVVRDLVCCACNGLASGGLILVGNELGKGDLAKGKDYGKKMAVISFICGGASTIVMLLLTPALLSFVKLSGGAKSLLLQMMLVMSIYMIGRAVNTIIINGVFAAGGDTLFDVCSLVLTMWCLAIPLAVLGTFVLNWPPIVVYAMTCLDEVGKIPWVMFHFRKYKWVRDLTVEENSQVNP